MKKLIWLGVLIGPLASIAAHAQTTTYSFTGIVTANNEGNGSPVIGQYVTGTYTFSLDSADKVIGSIGATLYPWAIGSSGVPFNPVFASKVIAGDFIYTSGTLVFPEDPDNFTTVAGFGDSTFSAAEAIPASDTSSFMDIVETDFSKVNPSNNGGLSPSLTATQIGYGGFVYADSQVQYQITSLTAGPLPAPTTLLTTLLAEVIGVGPGKKLEKEVDAALNDYASSNTPGACEALSHFISSVRKQDSKSIPPTLGVTLKRGAQATAAVIGCPPQ